jgi:serine/threonine-protein kinase
VPDDRSRTGSDSDAWLSTEPTDLGRPASVEIRFDTTADRTRAVDVSAAVLRDERVWALRELRDRVIREGPRFGKYTLLGLLGVGGMAEVHLAREPLADGKSRLCVIKRISEAQRKLASFAEMFREEQRLSRLLRHPNIVELYDAGEIDGTLYMSFELIDAITLADLRVLRENRPCPLRVLIEIALGVASALEYAHQLADQDGQPLQLVHRDVSPQNVLITRSGTVKLVDFGIARFDQRQYQTRVGFTKGKLRYMSPEHLSGRRIDGRSDLFSFGLVLLEVLSSQPIAAREAYYDESELKALAIRVTRDTPDMPNALEELLLEMLSFRAAERPESAAAVRERLEGIQSRVEGQSLAQHVDALVFSQLPPIRQAIERAVTSGVESEPTSPALVRSDESTLEDSWQENMPTVQVAPNDPSASRGIEVIDPIDWSEAVPTAPPDEPLITRGDTEAPKRVQPKTLPRWTIVTLFALFSMIAALISALIYLELSP